MVDRINVEEFLLLGHNSVYSVEHQRTYRRDISPPSSGLKYKSSKFSFAIWFHAGFLLGLFIDPEDGNDMLLRNVD
jgi:hypothetical protein